MTTKRNYFGGFPLATTFQTKMPQFAEWIQRNLKRRFDFSGNMSAYGATIPLIYGHCLIQEPILLFASDQVDFLTTGWIVGEGVFATNSSDATQSSNPLDAYWPSPNSNDEHIYVNGARRHDTRTNFGIGAYNGAQDAAPPSTAGFFADTAITEFDTYSLAMWGTAWVIIKTKKENNTTVDINSALSASFEVKYGRVVRIYDDATTFNRRATTNPAWVLLDYETSKRAGGGYDYARFDKASFKTVADYNSGTVSSVIDGDSVLRWTFNGALNDKKAFADYERLICLGMMCTPPFTDVNGLLKIKSLKSETLSGLPFFSSKSGTAADRNILWNNGRSSLVKKRKNILEIPNQLNINYMEWDGSSWIPTTGVVEDQTVQYKVGTLYGADDGSRRVVSKNIDLIGTTSRDEVARIGSLILRVGEFAQGGLNNNCIISFQCPYKTSADVEIADIIEVQDDLLDSTQGEQYFRVIEIKDDSQMVDGGGFIMVRNITATVHSNAFYDDSALTLTTATRIVGPVPNDKEAPPVTGADIDEQGIWDTNNKPMTELLFTYTEPDPLENFKDVVIMRSTLANPLVAYDAVTNQANDDWRLITALTASGDTVRNYEISNTHEVFTFLSRNIAGVTPNPRTMTADGTAFKYPRIDVLVDGIIDTLPAPGSFSIATGNIVTLRWVPYTGNNLKLFKTFRVYRDEDPGFGSPDLIASTDATMFIDGSVNVSTTYYYKVVGVSILNQEGTYTSALSTVSPSTGAADSGTPTAPIIGTVRSLAQLGAARYELTVGVDSTGSDTDWNTIFQTEVQITTDVSFASFPTGKSLNRKYKGSLPPMAVEFSTNFPGTYYCRARVWNTFGAGAWSSTLTRSTDALDNLTADTDLIAGVTPTVTVRSGGSDTDIPGNAFDVEFEIPTTNTGTYWGYSLYAHDSSTMPSNTTQETGTAGALVAGVAVLTDATKSWTTDQWVNKDVVIFSDKRGGSPTFDGEGGIFLNKILSNTATTLTFDAAPESVRRSLTGLKYHIINRGATHHYFEKLKFCTPAMVNEGVLVPTTEFSSKKRKIRVHLGFATAHFWVALYNAHGQGKIPSSVSANYSGLQSAEIGDLQIVDTKVANLAITTTKIDNDAITTPKIAANQVTASRIEAWTIAASMLSAGLVTAGTFRGTVFQTATSGARIEMDATNGLRSYDGSGNVQTQIGISTNAGQVRTRVVQGFSDDLFLASNNANQAITFQNSGGALVFQAGGSSRLVINSSTISASGGAVFSGNGSSLSSLDASNISTGTLASGRLSGTYSNSLTFSSVAGLTMSSANINFTSGFGIASGSTAFEVNSSYARAYHSSNVVLELNNTNAKIMIGGVLYTLSVDGSGFVKAA